MPRREKKSGGFWKGFGELFSGLGDVIGELADAFK